MKHLAITLGLLLVWPCGHGFSSGDGPEKPPKVEDELKSLQGKWKLVTFECAGKKYKIDNDYFILIDPSTITWDPWMTTKPEKGRPFRFAFNLDPTTKPKTLRLIRTLPTSRFEEQEEIKWPHGYELKGDDLKLVYDAAEGKVEELPNSFDSKQGVLRVVATYKRVRN